MSPSTPVQGLENIRRRPGLYIGGTDQRALNGCVFELIANSIEEHLAGRCSAITVTIHADGSLSVKDDGGGISTAPNPQHKLPVIELVMTTLHVPDDYLKRPCRILGLCGVGTKCVNAVSEWMQINTVWEANEYQIAFARGRITEPLRKLPEPTVVSGTVVRFKPDPEIFKAVTFDRNFLAVRLDHLAVLHPKLVFLLVDERSNIANRPLVSLFHYPGGIADFLNVVCPAESRRHPEPVALNGESHGVRIALGFQFTESGNTALLSFANSSPTRRGGTHVQGFLEGLANTINELARPQRAFGPDDMRPGLSAFVGVWLEDPRYGGATKDELINSEVELAVRELVSNGFQHWAKESGNQAKWLAESLDAVRGKQIDEAS